jgi:hypothetical protein
MEELTSLGLSQHQQNPPSNKPPPFTHHSRDSGISLDEESVSAQLRSRVRLTSDRIVPHEQLNNRLPQRDSAFYSESAENHCGWAESQPRPSDESDFPNTLSGYPIPQNWTLSPDQILDPNSHSEKNHPTRGTIFLNRSVQRNIKKH